MEFRTTRRLPRFWEIAGFSSAVCIGAYTTACLYLVYIAPSFVPFVTATPKYLLSNIDPLMFLLLQLGLLFLAFDTNHRHVRARIVEVLDSRPITNLEKFAGRLIGVSVLLWIVVAVNVLVLHCFGMLSQSFGFGFAEPLQTHSLINLLVLDVPANLLIWCSLIVLLSSAFRSRLSILAISALLMLAYYFLVLRTPFSLLPVLSPSSNDSLYISDIIPQIASLATVYVRVACVVGAVLLILVATTFTTRRDGSSVQVKAVVGSVLLLVICVFVTLATLDTTRKLGQVAKWREFHESYTWNGSVDMIQISGDVHIDPSQQLAVDLTLTFDAVLPEGRKLVFTFNPNMTIQQLSLNNLPSEFHFANGLMEVDAPIVLEENVVHTLRVKAEGMPNPRFAYLNSALDYQSDPNIRARTVKLFGTEGSIYHRGYVGLMPSVYWYPMPGPVKGDQAAASIGSDYFDVDLRVTLERLDWDLVASGAIPEYSDGKYSVITDIPVSQIGLLASNFEKVALDIDGIEFSITLHERHANNLVLADDLDEVIRSQIRLILNPLAENGLSYPSNFLNLVEVPNRLRTVGGGWRMDTSNTLPGIILLKEHGYPTAPIQRTMDLEKLWGYSGDEVMDGQVRVVFLFFQHSVGPDNPWSSFPHRYWTRVTAASGEYAATLDQTVLAILSQLTFTWDFFSIHSTQYVADKLVLNPFSGYFAADPFNRVGGYAPELYRLGDLEEKYSKRPSVWEYVETNSLASLPSGHGSQKDIEHLLSKSAEIAKGLEAVNGRAKTLTWLADVRDTYAGTTFTHQDLLELAKHHEVAVEPFLTDWITANEVPGYVYTTPSITRISDDDQGNSRYQTTTEIRNVQPVAGYIQFDYQDSEGLVSSPCVLIDGHTAKQINLVTSNPPGSLYLETGLSRNRDTAYSREPYQGRLKITGQHDVDPSQFEQESEWIPDFDGIVVDDLDPGFHTTQENPRKKRTNLPVYLGGLFEPSLEIELDRGLPTSSLYREDRLVGIWQRWENSRAYGVFRKTYASALNRNGLSTARFSAELSSTGSWQLDYHIPELYISWSLPVDYNMALANNGESLTFTIRAGTMAVGWNSIQTFNLEKGTIDLDIVGSPTPTTLYADAIRWTRVKADPSLETD